jgi:hypothetical protein
MLWNRPAGALVIVWSESENFQKSQQKQQKLSPRHRTAWFVEGVEPWQGQGPDFI